MSNATPFIGESGSFTVTLQNSPDSSAGGRTGFQPYVDLIIPHTGADGKVTAPTSLPLDGVTVTSASLLGAAIVPQVVSFDAAGKATHPFARDNSGSLRVVQASDYGAKPGDQLVVLDLPFGSLVPEQPKMTITVNFSLSDHADLGVPLTVSAQGGFAFGRDALNNPTTDAPVLGAKASGTITPSLFTLSKSYNGPEGETATGPNFQRSFSLNFDIATGQKVLNPVFKDTLPEGVVVVGTPTMSVPGSVVYNPVSREVTFTPNGPLTGVAGTDVTGTINFYASNVLDPLTGAKVTLGNNLSGTLGWIPIDPRDRVLDPVTGLPTPILFTQDPPGPEASFDAKSIATQKGVALFTDVGAPGVGPGDSLQYTINIQISDYFEFQNLRVRDILSDGQTFVAGSARLTATEAGSSTGPLVFGSPNITWGEAAGVTTLDLNISGQLGGDGVLTGGLFPTGLPNNGPTTLQITYRTTIDTTFHNGTVVSQGDSVSNSVTVQGAIRNSLGGLTGYSPSDGSGSSIGIVTGNLSKEVYAINGNILTAPTGEVKVKTFDLVTYRLTYSLPQSILGKLEFTDFLPLPIFDADVFSTKSLGIPSDFSSLPEENTIQYGPSSLSSSFMTVIRSATPSISVDSDANSFSFAFTNLDPSPTVATIADFLFTVRVADDPFGDGLKLTNQVTSQEYKHGDIKSVFSTAIKQITLTEPDLRITKGVIQTDNNGGTFTLAQQGPVTFTAPGVSGNRFAGTINSTNLAATPINSDLNNIDGRDLVSFGIVVENKGSSAGGAFDVTITDTKPVGFSVPTSVAGLNLRVTDGAGNPIAFEGPAADLFTMTGIKLVDDNTNNIGALKPYNATSGQNIVIITYDLLSDDIVQPKQVIKNTSNVINYAAREAGFNYITERGPLKDDATVTTAIPLADKVAIETSLVQTGKTAGNQNLFDLAIGESITYEITATLPEGNIKGFNILDVLEQSPQKLTYLNASVVSIGGNLFSNSTWTTPLSSTGISHSNGTINFGFTTDVYNKPDGVVTSADNIKVSVTAFAANVAGNVAGAVVTNTGIVEYKEASGTSKTIQDTENAEIVEPIFDRTKAANVSIVERDDEVIYTVTMTNRAASATSFSAPAFDMTIEDALLPPQLTLKAGSAFLLQGPAGASLTEVGGKVTVTSLEMLPGETIKFQYTAKVAADVVAGTNLVNTVTLKGDSYPGTPPAPQEQRLFELSANQTVTVKSPELTKIVDSTSIPETTSSFFIGTQADLVIGEQVTYRIVVTAPEAVTPNFKVTDNLPFANDGGFQAVSASVFRIGSNLVTTSPGTPTLADSNGDGVNDRIIFDFGTVTAQAANVAASNNQIELLVTARVRDVSVNTAGAQATNEAKLTFGTSGQAVATATVDIVEPKLQIVKAITAPNGFVKPGETVDYTVTVSHLSTSTAPGFDLKVEDLISDPYLALVAGSVTTNRGSVIIGNGAGDTTLRVTTDKLLRNEPLVAGDVWTISFKAVVSAAMPFATTITNTATSSFDSAPGPGGRADGGTSTLAIPGSPFFEKTIISTSNPDTGSSYFDPSLPDLTIGEKLTYRMVITLPQGLTQNVSITDLLPAGLTPLEARVVSIGSLTAGTPVIGISGQTVTVTFGNVTNSTGAPIGAEDRITIDVDARVKDLPTLVAGDKLTNAAQANFTIGSRTGSLTAAASAEVVEAKLAIDKAVTPTPVTLGETLTYSVILSHQALSTAPAYNVVVQDLLSDPNLQFQAGSVSTSAGVVSTGNALGDTKIKIDLSKLMPGEVLSISFLAKSISMPLPSGIVTNTATFGFVSTPETSLPSTFIRSGSGSDSADVQIVRPTLVKTVDSTSIPETGSNFFDPALVDLAIGEQVTYRLKITMPEAVTPTMKVTDYLPFASTGGFEAISASVAYVGNNLIFTGPGTANLLDSNSDGIKDRVSFDFGTVSVKAQNVATAQNQIELLVTARVRDIVGNTAGTVAENQAKLTFGASGEISDSAKTEIVEPKLQIVKAVVSPTGFVKPGETLDYTVTVSHLSASTAPGFDLKVEDLISDPNLSLVVGSVTTNRGIVALGNAVGDTTLRIAADKLLVGQVWTIGFKALVSPTMPHASTINNEAVSSFDSAPGPGGRPDGGTSRVSIPGSPSFDKAIISTSNPDTGSNYFDPSLPDLTIGEKLTYRMVITLPQGLTQNVSITDLLPAGLTPLEARVVSTGSLTAGTPVIGISGQTVTVTFGNVTNSTGAPIGAEDRITIDVDARVKDLPGLVAGNKLTNAAQADFQIGSRSGSLTAAASAEVVEAKLAIDKQVTPTTVTLGETFTYSVILSHEAASTAPAYNVLVKDLLSDPNLRLQAGSVVTSAGVVNTGNASGDQNIKIDLAKLMPGEVLRVSFQAKIETMPLPNGVVSNTATFGFVSTPDTLPSTFIRSGSGSDSADVQVATPALRPSDQSPLSSYQETFKRVRHGYWELPIVLAGTAEPGAAVGLEIRDATGAPVSVVGITADVGGHWMAPPIFTSAMQAQDLDALASLRSLAGRQTAPAGETPLSQPLPAAWLPTTTNAPYTVLTSEAGPAFMREGFKRNMDVTFNGVVDSEGAIASDPAQAFMVEKSASSTWSNRPGLAPPGSLVWNSFARDFAINRQLGR
ncbi:MAG: isopeptide-forming domain-containing fimbrial protein [Rhodocyclaceae bacterium]|nr:isopeptide-forming domain-containing fimbrial protein [Rhodocyclaceae bacterium]